MQEILAYQRDMFYLKSVSFLHTQGDSRWINKQQLFYYSNPMYDGHFEKKPLILHAW